jgi:heterodisulfide reductase subunit A-like polyferredoxin
MSVPQDPFLREHYYVTDSIFALGGRRTPLSIRDQMVRACMAIDRLLAEGYINTSSRKLLVVGGGVAGATAAVFAASAGIHTILVERATGCFLRQSRHRRSASTFSICSSTVR